jgi:hemolysin III
LEPLQTKEEEKLNTLTHGLGAIAALVGVIILSFNYDKNTIGIVPILVYGVSLVFLFSASTVYHYISEVRLKRKFRILDHISIYFLIAGTYTPICLSALKESQGINILIAVWTITAIGLILKLFFTGKFEKISLLLYLIMGWLIVLDYSTFVDNVTSTANTYLILGGAFYTFGVVFYVLRKLKYHHVIWHVFVLLGALFHYLMTFEILS